MTALSRAGITAGMGDDLSTALDYHQRGLLDQAARIYRDLLDRDPAHPDALHLLGAVGLQQGQAARAAELIGRAIAVKPGVAAFHSNLAEAYRALGQLELAVESGGTAIRLRPDFPEAANNLGLALLGLGR